jgi:hypothetical protein
MLLWPLQMPLLQQNQQWQMAVTILATLVSQRARPRLHMLSQATQAKQLTLNTQVRAAYASCINFELDHSHP